MDEFLVKLQKLKSGIFSRMKLLFLLDMVAIFSIFYSLFIVVNMEYFLNKTTFYIPFPVSFIPPALALFIGAGIALLLHRKDRKINLYLLIEKKFSELKEKLRTAYDNRDESNTILDALKSEVSEGLDKVSSEKILTTGNLISRLVITIIFLSGTVIIAQNPDTRIPVQTIEDIGNTLTGNGEKGGNETMDMAGNPEEFDKAGEDGGGNIKGKPKIATIEGKNIDLTIFPGYESGYELKDVSQTQNQFIKSAGDFPVDILGSNVSDGGYSLLMKKTETEKQLINKYAVERTKI